MLLYHFCSEHMEWHIGCAMDISRKTRWAESRTGRKVKWVKWTWAVLGSTAMRPSMPCACLQVEPRTKTHLSTSLNLWISGGLGPRWFHQALLFFPNSKPLNCLALPMQVTQHLAGSRALPKGAVKPSLPLASCLGLVFSSTSEVTSSQLNSDFQSWMERGVFVMGAVLYIFV